MPQPEPPDLTWHETTAEPVPADNRLGVLRYTDGGERVALFDREFTAADVVVFGIQAWRNATVAEAEEALLVPRPTEQTLPPAMQNMLVLARSREPSHATVEMLCRGLEELSRALQPLAQLSITHLSQCADDRPLYASNETVLTLGDVRQARRVLGLAVDADPSTQSVSYHTQTIPASDRRY